MKFFKGKRKYISIPIIVFLSLLFLPIVIGAVLGFLVYKKVANPKIKYSLIGILLFLALAFISAIYSPSDKVDVKSATSQIPTKQQMNVADQKVVNTPTSIPTLTPTLQPTIIPTVFLPTVTSIPTVPQKIQTSQTGKIGNSLSDLQRRVDTNSGGDKDCPDFATHSEAQAYFVSKGGSASYNADRLDNDGDGIACEDN